MSRFVAGCIGLILFGLVFSERSSVGQDRKPDAETKALIVLLSKDLKSKKASERAKAAEALGELGDKAESVGRELAQTMLDSSPKVALAATKAMEKVFPELTKELIPLIVDNNATTKTNMLASIAKRGPKSEAAVPIVLAYIRAEINPQVKASAAPGTRPRTLITTRPKSIPLGAILALASIAPRDKDIAKLMIAWMLQEKDASVRAAAARSLGKMAFAKESVSPYLASLKTEPAASVRVAIIESLAELKSDAKEALDQLEIDRTHSSPGVRQAAEKAIREIRGS